jgi:hypothetical protein
LKRAGETNGCSALVILQANPTAASADPAKLPHDEVEAKPATCPCVIPNRNNPAASPSRTPPGTSKLRSSAANSVSGST